MLHNKKYVVLVFVLILSVVVGAFGVAAQDEMDEADAMIRNLDIDALPEGWTLPGSIGHVTNYLVHEWYQNETAAEALTAENYGIEFSINDANLDLQASLAAVDDYIAQNVEALVFTPVDEAASAPAIRRVARDLAVVCEGTAVEGCATLVAISDYSAGYSVGIWAGEYAIENFDGEARVLDIGLPALTSTVARSDGFRDGLLSVLPEAEIVQSVDGAGSKDVAVQVSADALTANPDVNIIFGINDDSALGGLQSYIAAGLDTDNLLVVGFGCEGIACKDALQEGGPYKVSAAMFPEYQGLLLINAAVAVFNGVEPPEQIYAPSLPVTLDNLFDYYTQEDDGTYSALLDEISAIELVIIDPMESE
jgi:ribose transport system substrate-binding protein